MLILKQTDKERIVMYGYEDTENMQFTGAKHLRKHESNIVYAGTRLVLSEETNDFWKSNIDYPTEGIALIGLLKVKITMFKNYYNPKYGLCTAKESGLSALSQVKGEYILIVREVLK